MNNLLKTNSEQAGYELLLYFTFRFAPKIKKSITQRTKHGNSAPRNPYIIFTIYRNMGQKSITYKI